MTIKNFWSLEPGECIVAEELNKRLNDCQIFFPLHDTGTDLLITKGKKHIGIQVKESRSYKNRTEFPKTACNKLVKTNSKVGVSYTFNSDLPNEH